MLDLIQKGEVFITLYVTKKLPYLVYARHLINLPKRY